MAEHAVVKSLAGETANGSASNLAPNPVDLKGLVAAEVARQLGAARAEIDRRIDEVRERTVDNRATLIVFSGDLDKVLASLVIATGAASAGLETSMFFTFWGLSVLKKQGAAAKKKNLKQRLFALMTPSSTRDLGVSKMNYFGVGARMFRSMMKEKNVSSLEEMFSLARDLGVTMTACGMSMDVMGVEREELIEGLEYGGVAAYLGKASSSRLSLFI
jgi:peroxiredoxin family protein